MLFAKKEKFAIGEKVIKKELCAEDGTPLVRMNLRVPDIKCASGRDPLLRHAKPFYESLASTFGEYTEKELFKAAAALFQPGAGFAPFAALMSWEQTFISENELSIYVDVTVSTGARRDCRRRTQIWERKNGQRRVFYDFFRPGAVDYIGEVMSCGEKPFKLDRELFVLRENAFEFFRRQDEASYGGFRVTFDELRDNGLLRMEEF